MPNLEVNTINIRAKSRHIDEMEFVYAERFDFMLILMIWCRYRPGRCVDDTEIGSSYEEYVPCGW